MAPTLPPTDDRNEKPTSPVGGRNAAPTGDVTLRKCLEQDNSPSDSTVRVIHTAAVVSLTKRSGNTSSSSGPNDLAGSKH
ncbi:unnamed protein product [Soboliphyme baturini]|uniref:Uncharacterized protein n=1 Tax=Soboliphyme baturini TaxID=241478 RepID=A0A183IMN5_9BILA|nr:unnamed protein product [Soboliphyme baturini]